MTDAEQARQALERSKETNAYRLVHGKADGWVNGSVDRLGPFLLAMSSEPLNPARREWLIECAHSLALQGIYFKLRRKRVRQSDPDQVCPEFLWGQAAPTIFEVLENGLRYGLSFDEGYSCGLFLDQRDNRHRLLELDFASPRRSSNTTEATPNVLNLFAYTCAFSVCAAKAGARVTSIDLSQKYLNWGKENFLRNALDPAQHDFLYGDAFSWLRRLAKRERRYDCVVLDPPTFSKAKDKKARLFKVDRDLGSLVEETLRLLKPQGCLLVCSNMASWTQSKFRQHVEEAIGRSGRKVIQCEFQGLPDDFPLMPKETSYLKALWIQVS